MPWVEMGRMKLRGATREGSAAVCTGHGPDLYAEGNVEL